MISRPPDEGGLFLCLRVRIFLLNQGRMWSAFNNHFLKVSKSKVLFILKRPNDEAEFDTVGG